MVQVPEAFAVHKFYQYAGGVKFNRSSHVYNGSCPICREGKSWLKKRRSYYLPKKNVVCCHNCGWYGNPFTWVKEVGGYEVKDLIQEIKEFDSTIEVVRPVEEKRKKFITEKLPIDSINLFDKQEVKFWTDNFIVQKAAKIIVERRLNKAVNRPAALYISLNDYIHKNRITIPFYDVNNDIVFYQSRKVLDSDNTPKYLSKVGDEKSLFGINKVTSDLDTVFITEGPLDAFFVRNGLAVAGITQSGGVHLTSKQEDQLKELFLYEKVWLLDNQFLDQTSKTKTKKMLELGYKCFIWPNRNYKDLNEMCIDKKINEVEPSFILENTYTKLTGLIKLSKS